MMFFSVIVPVYNVQQYLDMCIKSVVGQSFRDLELILVNDGSTDDSGKLCDLWAQMDSRISVIHKKNGGASSARNAGIQAAKGQYFLFLDGDDYWASEDIVAQLANRIVITRPEVLIYNFRKEYNGQIGEPYFQNSADMETHISAQQATAYVAEKELWIASAWNKAILRECFNKNDLLFREGVTAEDIEWSARVLLAAKQLDYLDLCAVNYRQRINSVSGAMTPKKAKAILDNILYCLDLQCNREKEGILKPFIAYQYGVLLYNISYLPRSVERKQLRKRAIMLTYLLQWSNNAKITKIRRMYRCLGFGMTLWLLKIKNKLDSIIRERIA